jgi:hypothetical protein
VAQPRLMPDDEAERAPLERVPKSAWDVLQARVASAEHAADLKPLLEIGVRFRPVDREGLAEIVEPLVHATEWPASWVKPRHDLVRALEDLVRLVDPTKPESAFSRLGVSPPRTPFAMGSVVLRVVVHLLAAPCPPGELRYMAALCNLVLALVSDANRFELADRGPDVSPSIEAAREELGAALFRYGEAARAINDACGEALFIPLLSEH